MVSGALEDSKPRARCSIGRCVVRCTVLQGTRHRQHARRSCVRAVAARSDGTGIVLDKFALRKGFCAKVLSGRGSNHRTRQLVAYC